VNTLSVAINNSHRCEPLAKFSVVLRCTIQIILNHSLLNLSKNHSLYINIYQNLHTHTHTHTNTSRHIGKWVDFMGSISSCGAPQTLWHTPNSRFPLTISGLSWQVSAIGFFALPAKKRQWHQAIKFISYIYAASPLTIRVSLQKLYLLFNQFGA